LTVRCLPCIDQYHFLQGSIEPRTQELLYDTERVIRRFFDPISQCALQVYYSAARFLPLQAALCHLDDHQHWSNIRVIFGLQKSWSPCFRTMDAFCWSTNGAIAFSPDSSQIAAADSKNIEVRDVATGLIRTTCAWEIDDSLGISAKLNPPKLTIAFSPDSRHITVNLVQTIAGENVAVGCQLWDMVVGVCRYKEQHGHPTDTLILESLGDAKFRAWFEQEKWSLAGLEKMHNPYSDIKSAGTHFTAGGQTWQIDIDYSDYSPLASTLDGQILASLTGRNLRLWDLGLIRKGPSGNQERVYQLVSLPGGTHFASVLYDGRIERRSLMAGLIEWQYKLPARDGKPYIYSVSSDSARLALTYSAEGRPSSVNTGDVSVCILDLARGEVELEMSIDNCNIVLARCDYIVAIHNRIRDAVTLKIWEVATRTLVVLGLPGIPQDTALSRTGSHFAFTIEHSDMFSLWMVTSKSGEMQEFGTVLSQFQSMEFSPDGKYLTTNEEVFDIETGKRHLLHDATGKRYLRQAFSANGVFVARWLDYDIRIFEVATGSLRSEVFRSNWSAVAGVFSPEGNLLPSDRFHSVFPDGWLTDGNGTRKCWVPENYYAQQILCGSTLVVGGTDGLLLLEIC
jgi:WD40 repeat protein